MDTKMVENKSKEMEAIIRIQAGRMLEKERKRKWERNLENWERKRKLQN